MTDLAPPSAARRSRLPILLALTVGLLVGVAATSYLTHDKGEPDIVRGPISGVAAESDQGDVQALAFRFDGRDYAGPGMGEGIPVVADVPWTDAAGQDHQGDRPSCLAAGAYGRRVELGVLTVDGEGPWTSQLVV